MLVLTLCGGMIVISDVGVNALRGDDECKLSC